MPFVPYQVTFHALCSKTRGIWAELSVLTAATVTLNRQGSSGNSKLSALGSSTHRFETFSLADRFVGVCTAPVLPRLLIKHGPSAVLQEGWLGKTCFSKSHQSGKLLKPHLQSTGRSYIFRISSFWQDLLCLCCWCLLLVWIEAVGGHQPLQRLPQNSN